MTENEPDWTFAYVPHSDKYHTTNCQAVRADDVTFETTDDKEEVQDRIQCGHCATLQDPMDAVAPDALLSLAEQREQDESFDMEADTRKDEGWIKHYVECPECQTPMVRDRTVTEAGATRDDGVQQSESEYYCVCPNCREYVAKLTVKVEKGPVMQVDGF